MPLRLSVLDSSMTQFQTTIYWILVLGVLSTCSAEATQLMMTLIFALVLAGNVSLTLRESARSSNTKSADGISHLVSTLYRDPLNTESHTWFSLRLIM